MSRQLSVHRRIGRGPIEAHAIYPLRTFLARLGLGRHSLTALRKQGLQVRFIGRRAFIDGAEALNTLRRLWQQDAEQQAGGNTQ